MSATSTTAPWSERPAARRFADILVLGLAAAIATGLLHALGLAISALRLRPDDLVSTRLLLDVARGVRARHHAGRAGPRRPRPNDSEAVGARIVGLCAGDRRRVRAPVADHGDLAQRRRLCLELGIATQLSRMVMSAVDSWIVVVAAPGSRRTCRRVGRGAAAGSFSTSTANARVHRGRIAPEHPAGRDGCRARVERDTEPAGTRRRHRDSLRRGHEGVVFEWAFSTAPWTLPSHASMLTGLYARQQDGDWYKPLQDEARTLTETLRDRGYATGGFVANLHYTAWDTGLAQGFDPSTTTRPTGSRSFAARRTRRRRCSLRCWTREAWATSSGPS